VFKGQRTQIYIVIGPLWPLIHSPQGGCWRLEAEANSPNSLYALTFCLLFRVQDTKDRDQHRNYNSDPLTLEAAEANSQGGLLVLNFFLCLFYQIRILNVPILFSNVLKQCKNCKKICTKLMLISIVYYLTKKLRKANLARDHEWKHLTNTFFFILKFNFVQLLQHICFCFFYIIRIISMIYS
jgi:hypothetical protein